MLSDILNNTSFFTKLAFTSLKTLPRDYKGLKLKLKLEKMTSQILKKNLTVAKQFNYLTKKHPYKPAIIFENEKWTFQNIEDYSNKVAHSFSDRFKLKKGDTVAIFMENKPEFVATWLGLSKLGVISALINTNLKQKALSHSISVANAKVLVYSADLKESLNEIKTELNQKLEYVVQGNLEKNLEHQSLSEILKPASMEYFTSKENLSCQDPMLYIYTSGTTGLPKPAVIRNSRYFGGGYAF